MHNTEDRHSTYSTYRACHASHIARSPAPFALPCTSYGLAPPGAHPEASGAQPREHCRPDPAGAPVPRQYPTMVPHQYLIMASRDYFTIINIHRYLARLPVPTVLRVACASQWTRRPGAEEGGNRERAERGAGGQDIASQSSSRRIEVMLLTAGAEPTPRGGGGEGVALRYYCCDFS